MPEASQRSESKVLLIISLKWLLRDIENFWELVGN